MKKFVFTSLMALAAISLVTAPMLRAQDLIIKDPAEFNAYQNASTQSDPKAKADALESFVTTYPQSVVKGTVLDTLLNLYYNPVAQGGLGDQDKALSAASRLLQVDPNNLEAILYSVIIKKSRCKPADAQTCDDSAVLAHKGLLAPKPATVSDKDWKTQTDLAYPNFYSAIAYDLAVSKKDFKGAEDEYTKELMLYTDDQTKSGTPLQDTYLLAMAYSQPSAPDPVKSIWFYARVWNFVPAAAKARFEADLERAYKNYHGNNLNGLDDIKTQAALTTFPPGTLIVQKAPTPAELAHDALVGGDPAKLSLSDKEFILANGVKADADTLWALLKDQATPVPGAVIDASATALKVAVTEAGKTSDFIVGLTTPAACKDTVAADSTVKGEKDFILSIGVKADTDKIEALSPDNKKTITKISVEPTVSVIKVAVTDDAKSAKVPDYIVNLKTPLPCKEAPAAGDPFGQQSKGEAELDGTYDAYKQVEATATAAQSAEIVLRDGVVVPAKKKPVAAHKPAAGHRPVKK